MGLAWIVLGAAFGAWGLWNWERYGILDRMKDLVFLAIGLAYGATLLRRAARKRWQTREAPAPSNVEER
ncbi:MAG TPA: hypothetical protein VMB50_16365 [Myxococcales bacterium]|nr:hypothetical protein [Myxococcales bacterium]